MPLILPPREIMAPRPPKNFKFGIQVDLGPRALLSQTFGIFEIRGHLPPIALPREITAKRVPTTIKFGIQVDFGLFCHKLLEFLKLLAAKIYL